MWSTTYLPNAYPACRHDDHLGSGSGQASRACRRHRRALNYFDELAAVLGHLDDLIKTRILFPDASNEVLIKRYESVRRPHRCSTATD